MAISFFIAAIAVSCGMTVLALLVLRRPMSDLLAELCGNRRQGNFWVTLGSLCMMLSATVASTFPDNTLRQSNSDVQPLLLNAIMQCAFGLVGVLISLIVVVGALFAFIRRFEGRFRVPQTLRSEPIDEDTMGRLRQRKQQLWR